MNPAIVEQENGFFECFISFQKADPAGVVFFGEVFGMAHEAFEQFVIRKLDCSWKDWFQNPDFIVPLKRAEADYCKPLYAGEYCRIDMQISSVSETAFSVAYRLLQNELCCIVRTVHVFCDPETKKKIPIPRDLKEKLLAL